MKKWRINLVLATGILFLSGQSALAEFNSDLLQLQQRWAEVNYHLDGKTRLTAFETLVGRSALIAAQNPDAASIWIWSGVIKSTYSNARGGIGGLKLARAAKVDFERALAIRADALQGAAYTNLGSLYYNVPRWPIGFGNDKKAESFLLKGIAMNPDNIDSNYFYADYLFKQKRYRESEAYLLKAQAATNRPKRIVADTGRQKEITKALFAVREKLCD